MGVVGLIVVGYDLTMVCVVTLAREGACVFVEALAFDGEVGFGDTAWKGGVVVERREE